MVGAEENGVGTIREEIGTSRKESGIRGTLKELEPGGRLIGKNVEK